VGAFLNRFARSGLALAGLAIMIVVVVAAVFGPLLLPHDPDAQDILSRLLPPLSRSDAGLHLLGTDALGRDVASRLILGARISLLVGFAAVVLSGIIGVAFGLLAGYEPRVIGRVLMALTDTQLAIPFLVLALATVAVLGASLFNLIVVLGVANWVQYARVIRAEVLVLREREFVQAARALGASPLRIVVMHLLPNVASTVIVISSLLVAKMILFESSLSFLGLGVPPTTPTWGSMISEGRNYVARAWWVAAMPGIAIFLTVVSMNLVGDRLRDMLDPRLRQIDG
jgi:peptide/nickel transport system permease protein